MKYQTTMQTVFINAYSCALNTNGFLHEPLTTTFAHQSALKDGELLKIPQYS